MAVDTTQMDARNSKLAGGQDPRVMQRAVIICGIALLALVAIKVGFLESVLP